MQMNRQFYGSVWALYFISIVGGFCHARYRLLAVRIRELVHRRRRALGEPRRATWLL